LTKVSVMILSTCLLTNKLSRRKTACNVRLQQVGLTEEQWSAGHHSAAAMVRPFFRQISLK